MGPTELLTLFNPNFLKSVTMGIDIKNDLEQCDAIYGQSPKSKTILFSVASGGGREVQNTGTNNQGNDYTAYNDGAYAYRNHAPVGK